jgi:hypothetical protein
LLPTQGWIFMTEPCAMTDARVQVYGLIGEPLLGLRLACYTGSSVSLRELGERIVFTFIRVAFARRKTAITVRLGYLEQGASRKYRLRCVPRTLKEVDVERTDGCDVA